MNSIWKKQLRGNKEKQIMKKIKKKKKEKGRKMYETHQRI